MLTAGYSACEGSLLIVDSTQGVEAQTLANVYQALDINHEIVPVLKEKFKYKSIMEVPMVEKIVISQGVGEAVADKKLIENSDIIIQMSLIDDNKATFLKSKQILIGVLNPYENKNKLFNYVLQALETERNIFILDKLSKINLNQKSVPILYTYDSILFDVDANEENYIREVKSIMEKDGFPVEIEIGNNYDNMVKTNI